jgi:predicted TIM-barrel fold metal-dependent hydrolase
VIDVNVLVGATPARVPAADYDLTAATRELAAHGITSALVASRSSARYRHEVGNDALLSSAGSQAGVRIHPVVSLNPVQYLDWPFELERSLAAGAVAVRFFTDEQRWSVESDAFRSMVAAIRGRCPLLVPVTSFGDASRIGAATAEGGGPVVLLGCHYTQLGDCLAALERWPHLHLETSRLAHFQGVDSIVWAIGAERVLFGSGSPTRPIQAALNVVAAADISDQQRRAILADNAARLFGLPTQPFKLPRSTQAEGLIDVHGHFGALGLPTPMLELPEQVAASATHGITSTVASSLQAIADDVAAGNAEAFALAHSAGDTLRAYVVVNPNDLDGSCRSMDNAYARDDAVGAKLHCQWSGQPTAGPACLRLLHEVARRGRPLKIHVDGADWDDALASVAAAYPAWKLIVAHGGPGTPALEGAALVARTTNVYLELSTSFPDLPIVRQVVRSVGPRRLLFGSDAPLLDPAYALGLYVDAGADLHGTAPLAREVFDL